MEAGKRERETRVDRRRAGAGEMEGGGGSQPVGFGLPDTVGKDLNVDRPRPRSLARGRARALSASPRLRKDGRLTGFTGFTTIIDRSLGLIRKRSSSLPPSLPSS